MRDKSTNSPIKVSISFAKDDLSIAEKIIYGLLEKGIKVYFDNDDLRNTAENWGVHKFNLIDNLFDNDIQYCIVLISENYHREKWNNYYKCKLLENAIRRNNFILPVKIGDVGDIPGVTPFLAALQIAENQFQTVIDTFLEKIKKFDISDISEIRSYASIEKILKQYNDKWDLKRVMDEPYIDSKERIGFEIFQATDPLNKSLKQFFLFLCEKTVLNNTYKKVKEEYPEIFDSNNLIILCPKERAQTIHELRKKHIADIFKPTNVFYIDEFIWNHCTRDDFRKIKHNFSIKNFVNPKLKEYEDYAIDFLKNWLTEKNNPLLVIKGFGGIGKTTLVKKFSQIIYENFPNKIILYIDATEVVSNLRKYLEYSSEPLDIYNIYLAHDEFSHNIAYHINKDLFKINIDHGNVIFIIDGLDEFISKLGKLFNINDFLRSISDYSSDFGSGKVILTCRDYFWDRSNPDLNVENIELIAFDRVLAQEYFEKNFPDNEKAVQKGLKLSNELMGESENEFIPFVLDQVRYIIKDESDNSTFEDHSFNSHLLEIKIKNDYILFKICSRETEKLGQSFIVDTQVKFFITFATEFNSILKDDKINQLIDKTFNKEKEKLNINIDAMKAHPLLNFKEGFIIFRYDFFEEHFKNIYLGQLLRGEIEVNSALIEILANYVKFNSSFIEDIVLRLGKLNEEKKLILLDIIEKIQDFQYENKRIQFKERAISGLFLIALKSLQKYHSLDIASNTKLLKDLFLKEGLITNFSIYNVNLLNSDRIIFDFSDLRFKGCSFLDYSYFFECRFNKNTIFDSCILADLYTKEGVSTLASKSNFLNNCSSDDSVKNILQQIFEDLENKKIRIISDLKIFLKIFYTGGYMNERFEDYLKLRYKGRSKFDDLLNNLSKIDFIKFTQEYGNKKNKKLWVINEKYKEDAINFCLQGTMCVKINEIAKTLLEKYK